MAVPTPVSAVPHQIFSCTAEVGEQQVHETMHRMDVAMNKDGGGRSAGPALGSTSGTPMAPPDELLIPGRDSRYVHAQSEWAQPAHEGAEGAEAGQEGMETGTGVGRRPQFKFAR